MGAPEATAPAFPWRIHLVTTELENCSRGRILNIHLIYGPLPTAL